MGYRPTDASSFTTQTDHDARALVALLLRPAAAGKLAEAGRICLDDDRGALEVYGGALDEFDPDVAIVTP